MFKVFKVCQRELIKAVNEIHVVESVFNGIRCFEAFAFGELLPLTVAVTDDSTQLTCESLMTLHFGLWWLNAIPCVISLKFTVSYAYLLILTFTVKD